MNTLEYKRTKADGAATAQLGDQFAYELSIVMPCLNEAETLAVCIQKAQRYLEENRLAGEIVISDNGSTDGSQEIARRNNARVVNAPLRGYGAALYSGIVAARGTYVIMGDSDDSYDFSNLNPFLAKLRGGCDLVMGNRFGGGIKPGAMPWKHRYIGNPILSAIGRLFFDCPVKDFHCGLRGFSAAAFKKMDLRTTRMEFASEMVIKATLMGMLISEVPTILSPDGRSRPPHLRSWRDGWRHLRFMLLFSPRWLFLYPGIVLMLVGLITGVLLWTGAQEIGGISFDVHTMLYSAAAMVIGFQAILFALLSKIFATSEGLLPEDPKLNRLFRVLTLETGAITGILLVLFGIACATIALWQWKLNHFGPLDPRQLLRIVVPSVTALILGSQVVLFSLFFSILGLKTRKLGDVK